MNVGMVSKRYAKALLEYAIAQKAEDKIYSEMKLLAKQFANVSELCMAMDNPTLTIQDKLNLIKAAVGAKPSDVYVRFIELVISHKREVYLQSIALCYADLYNDSKHINTGKLVTASPVDKDVVQKMKALVQKIKPGDLDFEVEVDPDIEGGFVLYVDTYRYDASIKTQLNKIRQQLLTASAN